jgi:hypothetical protein
MQNEKTKEKYKEICLEKYGTENPFSNEEIKEKIKETCLEKYGTENPMQNEKTKEKFKETCLEKYGVEHPHQNANIMDKCSKNAYKLKEYTLPSGKTIKLQGYEYFAFDELLKTENIPEEEISNGCKNVPVIWYEDAQKMKHRHYVDIFISSQNRCIEVKSTWTAEKKKDNIFLKQQFAKELGYKYEIWVYNQKGERVECHM